MKYLYQSLNCREKSELVKHRTIDCAIEWVRLQIQLTPRDNDEGWRIHDLRSDRDMTLAEAEEFAQARSRLKTAYLGGQGLCDATNLPA